MDTPYKSEPKPYLRMEAWDKFNLQVVVHPILKRFSKRQRYDVLAVIALSMSFENLGVINQYDDEIARTLELSLASWMRLQPLLLLHHVLRESVRPSGRRVYEINPLLLVKQAGDQRSPDAFDPRSWDNAAPPMETFNRVPERNDIELLIPETLTPEERDNARGAARTALSRYLEKCRKTGQQPMNVDEFKIAYYRKRFHSADDSTPQDAPEATPQADDSGNASDPNSVTPDGNGNTPTIPEEKEDTSQTTIHQSNGNALERGNSVTEKSPVTVTENGGGSGGDVARFLLELGVFAETVEKHSGYLPSVEYAEMFVDWCDKDKNRPDVLPFIASRLERQRRVPKQFAEEWQKKRKEREARRAEPVVSEEAEQQKQIEEQHLDALYAQMEGAEKTEFDKRVETLLEGYMRKHLRWKNSPNSPLAQADWRKFVHAALREDGFPLEVKEVLA